MSPQNPIEPNNNPGPSAPEPLIRTMQKDIASLSQGPDTSQVEGIQAPPTPPEPAAPLETPTAEPPTGLPISDEIPVPAGPESAVPSPALPEQETGSSSEPPTAPDIKKQVRERMKKEEKLDRKTVEGAISQGLDKAPLAVEETTQDKERKEALKKAEEMAKTKQNELERRRRAEAEEQVPKEFADKMAKESVKESLAKGKKKVEQLGKQGKKGNILKYALISLAVVVVVGAIGGFLYWWNYIRVVTPITHLACQNNQCVQVTGPGSDQCSTDASCAPVEPALPASLIPVDQTKTIQLSASLINTLAQKLQITAQEFQAPNTLSRVLVKISNGDKQYMSLTGFLQALNLILPMSGNQNDYTLFFYSQPEGNRLGLIIDSQAANMSQDQLQAMLKEQESVMAANLAPIFLGLDPGQPIVEGFLDNVYQEVNIRYMNFPSPSLTIDYALVGDKIVITTSKASIYAAIDALSQATPPPANDPTAD